MSFEFTDATISRVLVSITDASGRKASVSFEENGVVLNRRRPFQGRKATLSYTDLLSLVEQQNPNFFEQPQRRSKLARRTER